MLSKWFRKQSGGSSAFLIGMSVCGLYYLVLHLPFFQDSLLHAYTTHHATEYAIVMLFFWACAEHWVCLLRVNREKNAVRRVSLPKRHGLEGTERAGELLGYLQAHHSVYHRSLMYQRIYSSLRFVHESQSVSGFQEYLESLEVRDSDQVFERYGFSRFVTTILPILGLIGTVVHFGAALTGLSMEGLTEKLPKMLSSMGTAFNTTFTAMTCMVVTFLVRFLVERRDNELLRRIDAYVEDELLHRFERIDIATKHVTDLLTVTNSTLLSSLVSFERQLIEEWNNRLDATQRRWDELNQRQELNFVHFLAMVERQQQTHVSGGEQWSEPLSVAKKMAEEIAKSLATDGQFLLLQERLSENLLLLQHSQKLDTTLNELTSAIRLFTPKQSNSSTIRLAS